MAILLATGFCCSSARAEDLPELTGPLFSYAAVSVSIPDPLPLATLPTLPVSTAEAGDSAIRETRLTGPPEPESPSLLNVPETGGEPAFEHFNLANEHQLKDVLKASPRESRFGSEEFVLLRKRMPSRYAYDSWANVQTGFGRFFPDEAIARCRTSGVGVEDPDWVYIKMTFKF